MVLHPKKSLAHYVTAGVFSKIDSGRLPCNFAAVERNEPVAYFAPDDVLGSK